MIRILSEDVTANSKLDSPLYLYDSETITLRPRETVEIAVNIPQGRFSFDVDAVAGENAEVLITFGSQTETIYLSNARQFGNVYVKERIEKVTLFNQRMKEVTLTGLSIFDGNFEDMVADIAPRKVVEDKRANADGWTLTVEVPIKDKDLIKKGHLIQARTKDDGLQYFRIGNPEIQKYTARTVAKHVFFDTEDYIVEDAHFVENSPALALATLNDTLDRQSPFTTNATASNRTLTADYVGKTFYEMIVELMNHFDMQLKINNWDFSLHTTIGEDRGVTLEYGKNIEDIKVFEDWSNVVTKILPIGSDDVRLPEKYLTGEVVYNKVYAKPVSFSLTQPKEIENEQGEKVDNELARIAELRQLAERYLQENQLPKLAYQVSSDINRKLSIGDIVHVKHPAISRNITTSATLYPSDFAVTDVAIPVTAYSYDILADRVLKIEYGQYSKALTSSIQKAVDKVNKVTDGKLIDQEAKLKEQTNIIKNLNKNGFVIVEENEIFLLDKLPKEEAQSVWRLGAGGIGLSKTGLDGDFITAWDINGNFSADVITAGTLEGSLIKTDSIQSHSLSLEAKEFIMSLTKVGGSNLLRNSVFFAGTKFWDASKYAEPTKDTWVLLGESKNGIKMIANAEDSVYTIKQDIVADLTKQHVFKTKINKLGRDGYFFVRYEKVAEDGTTTTIVQNNYLETSTFDGTIRELLPVLQVDDPLYDANHKVRVVIGISQLAKGSYVLLTDTIVAKGVDVEWSQAEGELYGTDVQIDGDGISVTRRDPLSNDPVGTTVMNPYEFAGYYGTERVFTLNGDITEVDGLLVKKQGIKAPPIQIVQNLSGSMWADIIWVGKD